jgi:hypothetical protein
MGDQLAGREAERREAERQEEVLGRDAEGLDVTHREVVADGEALTGHQRGLVRWVGRDATTDPLCDGALHDLLSAG